MKDYFLWDEEILAITAGQLKMFKQKQGVDKKFIDFCVEKINYYILKEEKPITFKVNNIDIQDYITTPNANREVVYKYNECTKMFFVNEQLLYKVLESLIMTEERITNLIYEPEEIKGEKVFYFRQKIQRMLHMAFEDTVRELNY